MIKNLTIFLIIYTECVLSHPLSDVYHHNDEKIDKILKTFNPFGLSGRLLPETLPELKVTYCRDYENDLEKALNYVIKKYPGNINIQVLFRTFVNEKMRLYAKMCGNKNILQDMTIAYKDFNVKVGDYHHLRDQLTAALLNTTDLSLIICYYDLYNNNIINKMSKSSGKSTIQRLLKPMTTAIAAYMKTFVKQELNNCNFSSEITKISHLLKNKSLEMTLLDVLNASLTQDLPQIRPLEFITIAPPLVSNTTTGDDIPKHPLAELTTSSDDDSLQSLRNPLQTQHF